MHKASSLRQFSRLCRSANNGSLVDVASKGFKSAVSGSPTVLSKQSYRASFSEDILKPAAFGIFGTASAFAAAAYFDQNSRGKQQRYGLYSAGRVYLRESDLQLLSRLPEGLVRDTAGALIGTLEGTLTPSTSIVWHHWRKSMRACCMAVQASAGVHDSQLPTQVPTSAKQNVHPVDIHVLAQNNSSLPFQLNSPDLLWR